MLLCDREERRIVEPVLRCLSKPFLSTNNSIPTSVLAEAMLTHVYKQDSEKAITYDNRQSHDLVGNA